MPEADLATLLAFFKAMANESRLRIVGLLAERERSVQELAVLLELKEPTVSHHLAALKACGLVSARAEGVVR
ncbi:MAG TPA: metalloregulator ArsR/SmtB family transcription factor, partial [Caulobacteraceae bacterium]|nr:metalloregulator ArsR/SmtB family transcription factor [Caulobacteraceae bacterium]